MERIRPSADLRNNYSEISRHCRESRQPVFITVNGREDTVIMGSTAYRMMQEELGLLRALAEAEDDVVNGRVEPVENTFSDIRSMLDGLRTEGKIR